MVLPYIERLLRDSIGLDVASIGASAVACAVKERQMACKLDHDVAYWDHVQASETEQQLLIEAVVVGETWFFRDRAAFTALGEIVQQRCLEAPPDSVCRLLSVPCSSGEEPYSMAMAILDAGVPPQRFRIDAVDISERVLAQARRGLYRQNSFRGADLSFRPRYFDATNAGYEISGVPRHQVRFQHGNVCSPVFLPSSEPYDVIFCRNLLIYFDRPTQNRVIGVLANLLAPQGVLFVGSSETAAVWNHGFVSAGLPMAFAVRRATVASLAGQPADPAPGRRRRPGGGGALARVPASRLPAVVAVRATGSGSGGPAGMSLAATVHGGIAEARRVADQGRFVEAAALCEEYLRRDGPSQQVFSLLALVHDATGNAAEAETFYRRALYLDPADREVLIHLTLLLDRQGRQDDALVLRNRMSRLETASKGRHD